MSTGRTAEQNGGHFEAFDESGSILNMFGGSIFYSLWEFVIIAFQTVGFLKRKMTVEMVGK